MDHFAAATWPSPDRCPHDCQRPGTWDGPAPHVASSDAVDRLSIAIPADLLIAVDHRRGAVDRGAYLRGVLRAAAYEHDLNTPESKPERDPELEQELELELEPVAEVSEEVADAIELVPAPADTGELRHRLRSARHRQAGGARPPRTAEAIASAPHRVASQLPPPPAPRPSPPRPTPTPNVAVALAELLRVDGVSLLLLTMARWSHVRIDPTSTSATIALPAWPIVRLDGAVAMAGLEALASWGMPATPRAPLLAARPGSPSAMRLDTAWDLSRLAPELRGATDSDIVELLAAAARAGMPPSNYMGLRRMWAAMPVWQQAPSTVIRDPMAR